MRPSCFNESGYCEGTNESDDNETRMGGGGRAGQGQRMRTGAKKRRGKLSEAGLPAEGGLQC